MYGETRATRLDRRAAMERVELVEQRRARPVFNRHLVIVQRVRVVLPDPIPGAVRLVATAELVDVVEAARRVRPRHLVLLHCRLQILVAQNAGGAAVLRDIGEVEDAGDDLGGLGGGQL